MSEPATALLDTTLLSNFAHARRPDLLQRILGLAATTPQVMTDLRKGEALGFVPSCDWTWLPVWLPTEEEARIATAWARQLDSGEAECLAVAEARRCRFLSDDFAAPAGGRPGTCGLRYAGRPAQSGRNRRIGGRCC